MLSIIKKLILFFLNLFGFGIFKKNKNQIQIETIYKEKNQNKKIKLLESIIEKKPFSPVIYENYLNSLLKNLDFNFFSLLNNFRKKKEDWTQKKRFDKINLIFLKPKLFIGAFGNSYAAETLIRAENLKSDNQKKKLICILPKGTNFTNKILAKYFSKYINFFRSEDIGLNTEEHSNVCEDPSVHLNVSNEELFLDIAANKCEIIEKKKELNKPIFKLNSQENERGYKVLSKFGLTKNDWFVTFHIREKGYRNETIQNNKETFRNSNPNNFIEAMKFITKQGGWVIRVGDKSMSNLPKMKNVIDYANENIKSELMDIFLAAKSKFCVGTDSGYFRIPRFFGVPVLLTNTINHLIYYSLKSKDLYLPKLVKRNSDNYIFKFQEVFSQPFTLFHSDDHLKKFDCITVENTSDEITNAVSEMIKKIDHGSDHQENNQKKFKLIAEKSGAIFANKIFAFADCSKYFLNKHEKLL